MFERGNLTIGRWRGVPIRVNWTAPLGALMFGGIRFAPGFWLGFFLLIIVHELGHAYLVKQQRLRVVEVLVHGFGGHCRHERGSEYAQAIIAWGGVLAQFVVLFIPAILVQLFVPIRITFVAEFLEALIRVNLVLIAFNLIPFPPLDGAQAWKLPKMWWARRNAKKRGMTKSKRQREGSSTPPKVSPLSRKGESPEEAARRIAREALEKAGLH